MYRKRGNNFFIVLSEEITEAVALAIAACIGGYVYAREKSRRRFIFWYSFFSFFSVLAVVAVYLVMVLERDRE